MAMKVDRICDFNNFPPIIWSEIKFIGYKLRLIYKSKQNCIKVKFDRKKGTKKLSTKLNAQNTQRLCF